MISKVSTNSYELSESHSFMQNIYPVEMQLFLPKDMLA